MALTTQWDAGVELVEAGLIPSHCCEFTVTVKPNHVVVLETKTYCTDEQWSKLVEFVQAAKEANALVARHSVVNLESGEVAE
jgi:hypothetical protein